jgi:hypothetical protein
MPGAHVTRVGFPGTLDQFEAHLDDLERTHIESLLANTEIIWSTSSWALVGDVVFFQMTLSGGKKWEKMYDTLFKTRHSFFPEDTGEVPQ